MSDKPDVAALFESFGPAWLYLGQRVTDHNEQHGGKQGRLGERTDPAAYQQSRCRHAIEATMRDPGAESREDHLAAEIFNALGELTALLRGKVAEPGHAPDDLSWLRLDALVYADDGHSRGWGTVKCIYGDNTVMVALENGTALCPDAACHREGPQSEPPGEGATFLGRHEVAGSHDRQNGLYDFWWLNWRVYRGCGEKWYTPKDIDKSTFCASNAGLLNPYRAALANARALGLVEDQS